MSQLPPQSPERFYEQQHAEALQVGIDVPAIPEGTRPRDRAALEHIAALSGNPGVASPKGELPMVGGRELLSEDVLDRVVHRIPVVHGGTGVTSEHHITVRHLADRMPQRSVGRAAVVHLAHDYVPRHRAVTKQAA